ALPSYNRAVEKSRASGPMANLASIAKAQNAQKLGTAHYTDNVGNLDISLRDEATGQRATGSTFESEYFTYRVYGDDKEVALATRKNVDEDKKYELSVDYKTNKLYCRPITNKTCIDLHLEEGQDYAPVVPCNGEINAIAGYDFESIVLGNSGSCGVKNGVIDYQFCKNNYCQEGHIEGDINHYCNTFTFGGFNCFTENMVTGEYHYNECVGGTCLFGYSQDWDSPYTSASCSGSNVSNEECLAYDEMSQEDYNNGTTRTCLEIEGLNCKIWGEWSDPNNFSEPIEPEPTDIILE
ncbi:MAG: hypothetical protein II972_05940, partial [Elusimicrobiaceae bacterium]|nr:hypothetical protein [Elusimicrobiaceae bacterium]